MQQIRILVVDDSVTMRAMIETLLERDNRISIVGIARNADEAFQMIDDLDPDVVTLDVAMPGKDGMALLDEIMASRRPKPVIMLSSLMREGSDIIDQAIAHGAAACFNKAMVVREANKLIQLIEIGRAHV